MSNSLCDDKSNLHVCSIQSFTKRVLGITQNHFIQPYRELETLPPLLLTLGNTLLPQVQAEGWGRGVCIPKNYNFPLLNWGSIGDANPHIPRQISLGFVLVFIITLMVPPNIVKPGVSGDRRGFT